MVENKKKQLSSFYHKRNFSFVHSKKIRWLEYIAAYSKISKEHLE